MECLNLPQGRHIIGHASNALVFSLSKNCQKFHGTSFYLCAFFHLQGYQTPASVYSCVSLHTHRILYRYNNTRSHIFFRTLFYLKHTPQETRINCKTLDVAKSCTAFFFPSYHLVICLLRRFIPFPVSFIGMQRNSALRRYFAHFLVVYRFEYRICLCGYYCVSKTSQSVHPMGKPINHSTKVGFSLPPITVASPFPDVLLAPFCCSFRILSELETYSHMRPSSVCDVSFPMGNRRACLLSALEIFPQTPPA